MPQSTATNELYACTLGEHQQIQILPKGGLLHAFLLDIHGEPFNIIQGFNNQEQLHNQLLQSYNSARLAPFPNRIRDGRYHFKGKSYQLPINFPQQQHAIHGFLAAAEYTVTEHSTHALTLTHEYDGSYPGFPFPFHSTLHYQLTAHTLSCTTMVKNTGTNDLPYAEGWHPYFQLGGKVDDWFLSFPSAGKVEVDKRMIPTNQISSYQKFNQLTQLGDTHFDTCFTLQTGTNQAQTRVQNKALGIQLTVTQELGMGKYNYLQLYTPDDRRSLAIEPMTALPDALNNQEGLVILKPNQCTEFTWQVAVNLLNKH